MRYFYCYFFIFPFPPKVTNYVAYKTNGLDKRMLLNRNPSLHDIGLPRSWLGSDSRISRATLQLKWYTVNKIIGAPFSIFYLQCFQTIEYTIIKKFIKIFFCEKQDCSFSVFWIYIDNAQANGKYFLEKIWVISCLSNHSLCKLYFLYYF